MGSTLRITIIIVGRCLRYNDTLYTYLCAESGAALARLREPKPVAARHVSEPPDTPKEPRETEASKMSFLSVFSFGGSPTSQDAPTPIKPAADEVVEIKVEAPAPEPAVEVKEEEPKPAPPKACCVVC